MSFERKMIFAAVIIGILALGSCVVLLQAVKSEFEGCKGLKGAVNEIWTGEECGDES